MMRRPFDNQGNTSPKLSSNVRIPPCNATSGGPSPRSSNQIGTPSIASVGIPSDGNGPVNPTASGLGRDLGQDVVDLCHAGLHAFGDAGRDRLLHPLDGVEVGGED